MFIVRPNFGDKIAIYSGQKLLGTLSLTQGSRIGIAFDFPRDVKIDPQYQKAIHEAIHPEVYPGESYEVPAEADN